MAKRIKAVIFDWAGITIDYGCFAPVDGFIKGFQSIGFDITSEMARRPMGLSKIDHMRAIAKMLPVAISEEQIQAAYKVFEKTLFNNIAEHCDVKDYVLDTVSSLRLDGIKIGSTTGYTSKMMEEVLPIAARQGYAPDYWISGDLVPKGRPYPYMIWQNLMQFSIQNPRLAVKVGDTIADIEEGKHANCWTVAIVMGSSELGLSRDEVLRMDPDELANRKALLRRRYSKAGVDYIINDMDELKNVILDINQKLAFGMD